MKYLEFDTQAAADAYSAQVWASTHGAISGATTSRMFTAVELAGGKWALRVTDETLIPADDRAALKGSVTLRYTEPA